MPEMMTTHPMMEKLKGAYNVASGGYLDSLRGGEEEDS